MMDGSRRNRRSWGSGCTGRSGCTGCTGRSGVITVLCCAVLLSCGTRSAPPTQPSERSLFSPISFSAADPGRLTLVAQIELPSASADFRIGDVVGDEASEIVLLADGRLSILDYSAVELATAALPGTGLRIGFLGDVSGDGKREIVLGGSRAPSALIAVYDGLARAVAEVSLLQMFGGETYPQFNQGSRVYFTAHGAYATEPRVVGAVAIHDWELQWLFEDDVTPIGLSPGAAGSIAVSHRAAGRDRGRDPDSLTRTHDFLLLDSLGNVAQRTPFTAQTEAGSFADGQASGITITSTDGNGDQEAYVVAVERMSELYRGRAELHLTDRSGRKLATLKGPPASAVSYGWYPAAPGEFRYAVVWAATGEIALTDSALQVVRRGRHEAVPPSARWSVLEQIGRFAGDGRMMFLVRDDRYLTLFDEDLNSVRRWTFANPIQRARFFAGTDGDARLAVLAGDFHLLAQPQSEDGVPYRRWTEPDRPPRIAAPQGEAAPGWIQRDRVAAPRRATVTIPREAQAAGAPLLSRRATRTVPNGARLAGVTRNGRAGRALVVAHSELERVEFFDADLQRMGGWHAPGLDAASVTAVGDITGDGRDEVFYALQAPLAASVRSLEGELLFHRPITGGFDSFLRFSRWVTDRMLLTVNTGFLLAPRGLYFVDFGQRTVTGHYPMAGRLFSPTVSMLDGRLHPSLFTPSNRAELLHDDGFLERDTHLYVHVVDTAGAKLPLSAPRPEPYHRGAMTTFVFDGFGTTEPTVYYADRTIADYYPGVPRIYRFEADDGSLIPLLEGPADTGIVFPAGVLLRGRPLLALSWMHPGRLDLVDTAFRLVHRIDTAPWNVVSEWCVDITGDGNSELMALGPEGLAILDTEGEVLQILSGDGRVSGVVVDDVSGDGRMEVVVLRGSLLEVYGY